MTSNSRRRLALLRRVRFRARLRDAFASGADVLHVEVAASSPFDRFTALALREGRAAGLRTVLRWDGAAADAFGAGAASITAQLLSQCADDVVVPAASLRNVLRARFGVEATVIPRLVDDPGFEAPAPPERRLRLFTLCEDDAGPGARVVLAAVVAAVRRSSELELVVAGSAREMRALARVARRELRGRVEFLGALPDECVLDEVRGSSLVVSAGYVGPMLAEALAAGVPVATTACEGVSSIVDHGATGLVTAAGDADALAASIAWFDAHRDALAEFGLRAKVQALRWTWQAVRSDWAHVYGVRTGG